MYPSLHCHHQNDTCIKMGSDESHFNVSLIVRDKVARQCPQTTTFEEKGEGRGGYGGGERRRLYTYRCTVTTRMTPALRWAAMRAVLMFH